LHPLLKSLAIALATSLIAVNAAHAQSTEPKAEEPTNQEALSEQAESEKKKPVLTADQKELDKQLLGAWAVVTDNIDAEMTDELFRKAIESCETVPQIKELDAESGLKEELPEEKEVRGQLVYFRTDQGLQRFETEPGSVVLLPDIQKAINAEGRTVWQVSGRFAQFAIAFADALQGANTLLMLEENRLFLKCESQPQTDG